MSLPTLISSPAANVSFTTPLCTTTALSKNDMRQRLPQDEELGCRARATECAALVMSALGKEAALAAGLEELSGMVLTGMQLEHCELREYAHCFFGHVAKLLDAEFARFLPAVTEKALQSIQQVITPLPSLTPSLILSCTLPRPLSFFPHSASSIISFASCVSASPPLFPSIHFPCSSITAIFPLRAHVKLLMQADGFVGEGNSSAAIGGLSIDVSSDEDEDAPTWTHVRTGLSLLVLSQHASVRSFAADSDSGSHPGGLWSPFYANRRIEMWLPVTGSEHC